MTRIGKEQEAAAMIASARRQVATAMSLLPRDPDAQQIRGEASATLTLLDEIVRKVDFRTGTDTSPVGKAARALADRRAALYSTP